MMKLIKNWRSAWRMHSVQIGIVAALVAAIQAELLPIIEPLFDAKTFSVIASRVSVLAIVLRLVAQPTVESTKE